MPTIKTDFFIPPEGRFCYSYLDIPRTTDLNGKTLDDPKYETVFYIPKTSADPMQCTVYKFLAGKVMEVVGQAFRGQWPERDWKNWPIRDGDAELEKSPWGAGCWRISLHSGKYRPPGVDAGNNPLARDVSDHFRNFKGGDYGIVSINCFSFDNITKGVSFGLEMFKKTRDGDPIGGGARPVEAVFGPPTGQPVAPPLPNGVYGGTPPLGPQSNYSQNPQGYGAPYGPSPTQQGFAPIGGPAPGYAPGPSGAPYPGPGNASSPSNSAPGGYGPGMPPAPPVGTR